MSARRWSPGAVLWAVLVLPPARHALESAMTLQMLVQIPLLALAGWWLGRRLPADVVRRIAPWDGNGIAGLLLASLISLLWMLPRMLDGALNDPGVALAKFLSVPLLIGVPVALSWPRAGFVVRGVFLLELVATAFRLGWLYRISPVRFCNNYLIDDQQRLGTCLLAVGFGLALLLGWKLIWGRIRIAEPAQR